VFAAAVGIWRAVSEDFAPFDVDVTTIPPGNGTGQRSVQRVCIGGNGSWYGKGKSHAMHHPCAVDALQLLKYSANLSA
jgi:hypothetical protein